MRLLALGYPLPNAQIDNYPFLTAPSFFDYDAICVDPAALSRAIEEVVDGRGDYATRDGQPLTAGPSGPHSVSLADMLQLRREEVLRLLARGQCVVCFLYPNVVHQRVSGFPGCDRYYWLPAPPGLLYRGPHLLAGYGRSVVPTDYDHPFAAYIEQFRSKLVYRAYFTDDIPQFGSFARVFARSIGGAAVGVEVRAGGGSIVFLPPLDEIASGHERIPVAATILDCTRRLLRQAAEEMEPDWVDTHDLPGLDELVEEVLEAERQLAEAKERAETAELRYSAVAKYRALLWQEGRLGLETAVVEAARVLGFQVSGGGEQPVTLEADGAVVFLETEGSRGVVEMDPHYRLRRRREEALAKEGRSVNGLLVVNGYRMEPPEQRPQQYVDALAVAAQAMRYCVVTAYDLFRMVRQALVDSSPDNLERLRRSILSTEGVLDAAAVVGER